MSSILVPVDFSTACHNAYRFALHMASDLALDVVLVHYYSGSLDPRTTLSIGSDGTIQGGFEKRLRQFAYSANQAAGVTRVEPPCGVEVTYETEVSLQPSAAIIRRAGLPDISAVVMPTSSSGSLLGKWLGSTSTTVSTAAVRPVYLIPPDARFQPFHSMVVANSHASSDPYPLWQLEVLAERYSSKIHFVHVEKLTEDVPLQFQPWQLMASAPSVQYSFDSVTVADTDVSLGLMDYADDVEADLLIVINQTRKRWQDILRTTLTQDLALRSRLPVLVLHQSTDSHPYARSAYATLRTA